MAGERAEVSPPPGAQRGLIIALLTTFFAGMGMNAQVRMNGQLVIGGAQPIGVAMTNMLIQLAAVLVIGLALPSVRTAAVRFFASVKTRSVPPWQFMGGFFGALMITSMGVVSPVLGVAVFAVCIVAGQTVMSLAVDRLGLGPAGRRNITPRRIAAALTAILGVVLSVGDRLLNGQILGGSLWALLLAVVAGGGLAIQAAANGRVARVSGSPMIGAGVNFVVGVLVLGFLVALTPQPLAPRLLGSDSTAWWLYFGAFFGLLIVINGAWAVRRLGVLMLTLFSVAGQLAGAVLADAVIPSQGISLSPFLFAGALLALVAGLIGAGPMRHFARLGQ